MKRLLSFLFVLFMFSPSLSQNAQKIIGVWEMKSSGIDDPLTSDNPLAYEDSVKYELKARITFEDGGKFIYGHSFKLGNSLRLKKRSGNWKMTDPYKITLIVRIQQTPEYSILFKKLNRTLIFLLSKDKTSAIFYDKYDENFTILFEKIDTDDVSIKETDKSPQKVLAKKKGIVI